VPDPRRAEALVAVIVPREGVAPSPEELREFCGQRLAAFKVPQHFIFRQRAGLPLTATGKVQKLKLREELVRELQEAAQGHAVRDPR